MKNSDIANSLEIVHNPGEDEPWEIKTADTSCPLVGPYKTRKDAEQDRQGLKRFYKHHAVEE